MFNKRILCGLPAVVLTILLARQFASAAFAPPNTPQGQRVTAYFTAFNSGEEAMKTFFLENATEQSLKQRPVEERLVRYRSMRADMGRLEPNQVMRADSESVTVLVKADSGWMTFAFIFEPAPPWKLAGIRIEQADSSYANQTSTPMTEKEFLDSLGNRLEKMAQDDEFSGVVLVARKNQPIFEKTYGLASREFNVPNRLDTRFNLGSINKYFTRLAIWQLMQEKKLSLQDTLGRFIPDYPNADARRKVTVNNLVEMTSGIGDFFGAKFDATPKDRFRTNRDYMPMFDSFPLAFEPGSQRAYSNGGYVLLGVIIESVSGQGYYDYVRDHIFLPAGMTNTDSYEADNPVVNLAEGYTRGPGERSGSLRRNIYTRPARGSSAGGGYSTVEDLLKFTVALQKNAFLTPANTEWFLTGVQPDSSNAAQTKSGLPPGIGIAGGAPGINASLEADFSRGYTVIVLGNYDPPNAERVARMARKWLEGVNASK